MCDFMSFIVLKNGDIHVCEDSSHETKIRELKLMDDTNEPGKLQFAKVEIKPPEGKDVFFADLKGWDLHIDLKPTWWKAGIEKSILGVFEKEYGNYVFVKKDNIIVTECKKIYLSNSHAVLMENSYAVLMENSYAELRGNSHAVLWENSTAIKNGIIYHNPESKIKKAKEVK